MALYTSCYELPFSAPLCFSLDSKKAALTCHPISNGLSCTAGTHHAFRDFGSGFCIINDLAVTSAVLLERGAVSRVLIVDLDVHQGDGTAAILAHEPRVFTMSVHAASNFPAKKQVCSCSSPLAIMKGQSGSSDIAEYGWSKPLKRKLFYRLGKFERIHLFQ